MKTRRKRKKEDIFKVVVNFKLNGLIGRGARSSAVTALRPCWASCRPSRRGPDWVTPGARPALTSPRGHLFLGHLDPREISNQMRVFGYQRQGRPSLAGSHVLRNLITTESLVPTSNSEWTMENHHGDLSSVCHVFIILTEYGCGARRTEHEKLKTNCAEGNLISKANTIELELVHVARLITQPVQTGTAAKGPSLTLARNSHLANAMRTCQRTLRMLEPHDEKRSAPGHRAHRAG